MEGTDAFLRRTLSAPPAPLTMHPAPKRGALPTALWLLRNSLWPVPIEPAGKRPIGKGWGEERIDRDRLTAVFGSRRGIGVGIALGPEPGVIDVEADDPAAAELLHSLPPSLGWSSARGEHRLYRWSDQLKQAGPAVLHVGGAELRLGGEGKQLVSVCPPTVGTDRRCRRWNGCWEVAPFPEELLRKLERPASRQEPTDRGCVGNRYAAAALRRESRAVRSALEGTRNETLNKAAFSLGQLISMGLIDRSTVEAELLDAALEAGLGEREILTTLRSGIEAGIARPRSFRLTEDGT